MSITYDSLRVWVEEFERRRALGHELLWSDTPRVKSGGINHQESSFGFWDLADDTQHDILVPVAMQGFEELPFMKPILQPKFPEGFWSIPVEDRPHSARDLAIKEGLRAV